MGRLLLLLALVGLADPADACINDNELPTHEREFRSQYGTMAARPTGRPDGPIDSRLLVGAGAAMLVGAVALASTHARKRA